MKKIIAMIFTMVAGLVLMACNQSEKQMRLGIYENHEGQAGILYVEDVSDAGEYDGLKKVLMNEEIQLENAPEPDKALYALHFDKPQENIQELAFIFYLVDGNVLYQYEGDVFGYDADEPTYKLSKEDSNRLINNFREELLSN
ncbi:hypothetical protein ACFOU0_08520 [Salinicoccus sesuvii]|uniref:DUF4825 domain-containing protein n=1 Tax=Salinicoccus sesuvii TaxID=868281 RepID=A0ABV7N8T3_9STAP